jgi:assimilatory nitrate reductase catalytic subunit
MTRTGLSPRLASHLPEPFVEVHPDDAAAAGLTDGAFAKVTTAHGACIVKVVVSENQQRGSLFLPIHWSDETASAARAGDLVAPFVDPLSGQPEAKATPAAIAPVAFPLTGFLRTRYATSLPPGTWWTRITVADGAEYRLATDHGALYWHDVACRTLAKDAQLAERLEGDGYHAAAFVDGEMLARLSLSPTRQHNSVALTAADLLDGIDGSTLKIVSTGEYIGVSEPIVCACFQVGLSAVRDAVNQGSACTVADLGRSLRVGTNCGSCLPELKRIVNERTAQPV